MGWLASIGKIVPVGMSCANPLPGKNGLARVRFDLGQSAARRPPSRTQQKITNEPSSRMSPKLASAMVCIGIAVGCLSAPKSSSSGAKPRHAISPTVQPSIVQSDRREQSPIAHNGLAGVVIRDESIDWIQGPPSLNRIAPTVPIPNETSNTESAPPSNFRVFYPAPAARLSCTSGSAMTTLGSVNAPLEAVAESLEFSTGPLPPALPGTNTFGVAIER